MPERQESYITTNTPIPPDYPAAAKWATLTEREQRLIEQWRKQPDGQAVIVSHDMARFMARVMQFRSQAKARQIGPLAVVNFVSLEIGTVNE